MFTKGWFNGRDPLLFFFISTDQIIKLYKEPILESKNSKIICDFSTTKHV